MKTIIEKLFVRFEKITPLSDSIKDRLCGVLTPMRCRRRQFLLREGETAKEVYYVISGLVRTYHIADGMEVCTRFMSEGQFITSWPSFYKQKPGHEYVQVVKDSELVSFSWSALQQLYSSFPEFNVIARHFFEYHLYLNEECIMVLRQPTAYKKYEHFLHYFPALATQLPVKYIAGFLGISKETLSRIRNQYSK